MPIVPENKALFVLFVYYVYLCSYFFLNKYKIMTNDFYLCPLWPNYPPFFFIFCYLERLCLHNREISLAVLLRQNSQTNMTKNVIKS